VRVAILDDIHNAYEATQGVRRLRERAEVKIFTEPFGASQALNGFDALIANRERTRFTREVFAQLPDLRIIAQTGNHAYHIDLAAAAERNVIVARATGGFSYGAAELALALALALMRQISSADREMKQGVWRTPMTRVLYGKTLGIIGLGQVGRHVATLGGAFGMNVISWSRGGEPRDLDRLLQESDVISIHAALTRESRGLIDARRLTLMKPTSYLINTARGGIVETDALVKVLQQRRIAGAGIDVFDEEPLPPGHPLTKLPNVVLTPHLGWPTDEAYERFAEAAADVLLAYLDGKDVPRFQ
jgi:phosphoglycerate dehydrogenase-like enzyme